MQRNAPGTACESCRKSKLRCTRTGNAALCDRCIRTGRSCLWQVDPNSASPARRPILARSASTVSGASPDHREPSVSIALSRDPITSLRNLCSVSPADSFAHDAEQSEPLAADRFGGQAQDIPPGPNIAEAANPRSEAFSAVVSPFEMEQLLEIFRDKLLPTALRLLNPDDFSDIESLLPSHRHLVSIICYVTMRYIPGYQKRRQALVPTILSVLQDVYTAPTGSDQQQLRTMQGLMILYTFAPTTVCQPSLIQVRAAAEAYAMRIYLHRSVEMARLNLMRQTPLPLDSTSMTRYIYWLWLYLLSHARSVVTKTPTTIPADASIVDATSLLQPYIAESNVAGILGHIHSCLLWDDVGQSHPASREWWTVAPEKMTDAETEIAFGTIDTAVARRRQLMLQVLPPGPQTGIMQSNAEFHMRLAAFCLNSQLVRPRSSASMPTPVLLTAVHRSIKSAVELLDIHRNIGPTAQDSLRYFPGFLFVSMSYCMTFILQALQAFPTLPLDSDLILNLINDYAAVMIDASIDRSHDSAAMGRVVLGQLRTTREKLRVSRSERKEPAHGARQPGEGSSLSAHHNLASLQTPDTQSLSAPMIASVENEQFAVDVGFDEQTIFSGPADFELDPAFDVSWDVFQHY